LCIIGPQCDRVSGAAQDDVTFKPLCQLGRESSKNVCILPSPSSPHPSVLSPTKSLAWEGPGTDLAGKMKEPRC
jgi:hypothetical protein